MCFLDLPQKIFFYFVVFDQFNIPLLIMLIYCHKIGEYINKGHSFQQSSDQYRESDKQTVQSLIEKKESRIALNKGPTISLARKRGPKKQSARVLQFLMKGTTI